MNREELKEKLAMYDKNYDEGKKIVFREYALSNNPYKVGDIIEDHSNIIRIDKITWTFQFMRELSECIYRGPRLKKNLVPFKSGERGFIYQSNIERMIA